MPDLSSIVLAAMLTVAKGPVTNDTTRLTSIAQDISEGATARHPEIFKGGSADVALGMMMVAIAHHESGFLASVDTCTRRGDTGRSISLFQILHGPNWEGHSAQEICANRKLAVRLALNVLVRPLSQKSNGKARMSPQQILNAYVSGSPGFATAAAKDMCVVWERLARGAGLKNAVCGAARVYDVATN
jgi:hypothetical protein